MDINGLLRTMNQLGASDLHLKVGAVPVLRLHGALLPVDGGRALTADELRAAYEATAPLTMRRHFEATHELDFSYQLADDARFRVNAAVQRGTIAMSFRRIPLRVPTLDELGLPPICKALAVKRRGLVLVTGPTGSGKSTTLAAMIEHLNRTEPRRIVTIEDPIEYLYQDQRCVITQRELGADTQSFAVAARQSLRQDPDVILVGEMRDPDTMAACLTAAETGHLVMSTLHTNSGPQTIDRITDAFPPHQQGQIRMQLSLTLEGVLSQALLPTVDGGRRVAAVEVMIATPAVRNLIREGKTHQMPSVIQTGSQTGMQTLDHALKDLVLRGAVSADLALEYAGNPETLRTMLAAG